LKTRKVKQRRGFGAVRERGTVKTREEEESGVGRGDKKKGRKGIKEKRELKERGECRGWPEIP